MCMHMRVPVLRTSGKGGTTDAYNGTGVRGGGVGAALDALDSSVCTNGDTPDGACVCVCVCVCVFCLQGYLNVAQLDMLSWCKYA